MRKMVLMGRTTTAAIIDPALPMDPPCDYTGRLPSGWVAHLEMVHYHQSTIAMVCQEENLHSEGIGMGDQVLEIRTDMAFEMDIHIYIRKIKDRRSSARIKVHPLGEGVIRHSLHHCIWGQKESTEIEITAYQFVEGMIQIRAFPKIETEYQLTEREPETYHRRPPIKDDRHIGNRRFLKVGSTWAIHQEVCYLEIQEGAILILEVVKEIASKNLRHLREIIAKAVHKYHHSPLRDRHLVEDRLPDPQILEGGAAYRLVAHRMTGFSGLLGLEPILVV